MGTLILGIIRTAVQVLAGAGVMNLLDTFIKPKVGPTYYPEPISPGFRFPKILWFIAAFVVGIMLLKFIGKKLNIKLLK